LLTLEDGLPSRLVNATVQDKAGFIWFATANGLCRFDGKDFKTFNTKNSNRVNRLEHHLQGHPVGDVTDE
jgi:ligand-binding sensor domain-containing protein